MLPRVWRELPKAGWWAVALVLSAGWTNFGLCAGDIAWRSDARAVCVLSRTALDDTVFLLDARRTPESLWLSGDFAVVQRALIMLWKPQLGPPLPNNLAEWIGLSAAWVLHCPTWCRGVPRI